MAKYTFSKEAEPIKRSVMRTLLAHAVDPNIISLATGLPNNDLMPVQEFSECMAAVLERDGGKALQYGPPLPALREWVAEYMHMRGVHCSPEQIFITAGAQQGLSLISRLFLDVGDTAVIEEVTFTGIKLVTTGRGCVARTIPTDHATGADMDALEEALQMEPRPKLVALISEFHNPLGLSITAPKRQRAAELAAKYNIPLIEDDPYAPLRFKGDVTKPIKGYDVEGYVFYLGSFSKMMAPAMRLGWVVAPQEIITKLVTLREALDLESSMAVQRAVAEYLDRGYLEPHLEALNTANCERATVLFKALETHLGDIATWTEPEGGLFVWCTLPEEIDTWDMFEDAMRNKVIYIPGTAFSVHGGHKNTMRLNFSNVTPAKIEEGISRLNEVIRERL